ATNHQGDIVVSLSSNISFCGVAKGEKLIAEAKCVKDGRSTCYYIIDVKDELDNMVAVVTINGFKK
ncbi:MAG: PaaI family thioesterase, partial [Lachnospiraceae bacterium]|nr:PaaI family thioesterase [Lachnospiraceae bacterium]